MFILLRFTTGIFITAILILVCTYALVSLKGSVNVYEKVDEVPSAEYAVVLGTSRYLRSGGGNPFFWNRIDAAVELYQAGKVDRILLSGHFAPPYYNEPEEMKKALVDKGVNESDLLLDTYGNRTFYSIIRAKHTYEIDSFIVVSQSYHAERALFIAQNYNIFANAYSAPDPDLRFKWLSLPYLREFVARARSVWDCYFVTPPFETEI